MSTPTMKQVVEAIGAPCAATKWNKHLVRWAGIYACRGKDIALEFKDALHKRRRRTLSMAKRVCEDWAGLLWTENASVECDEGPSNDLLTEQLGPRFAPTMTDTIERTFASGTGGLEVLIDGLVVSESGVVAPGAGATMSVVPVRAENIVPMKWERGIVTEAAFITFRERGFSVREHRATATGWSITNRAFTVEGEGATPSEIPAEKLIEQGIAPLIDLPGSPPLMAVFSPAIVNNLDADSPFGMSVIGNAESQLDVVDLIWDNFGEDFELGGKMVFIPDTMLRRGEPTEQYPMGKPIPPQKDKANLFVAVDDAQGDGGSGIHEHNPDLRVEANVAGLEAALGMLSAAVGMGSARYRYRDGGVETATQVISENSDLFRTRRKHLLVVADVMEAIARAVLWCGANLLNLPVDPEAEITVRFDDSVIEDDGTRIQRGISKVQSGVMSLRRYLIEVEGMTEEDADEEVKAINAVAAPLF